LEAVWDSQAASFFLKVGLSLVTRAIYGDDLII
jgi:hypothetical protein